MKFHERLVDDHIRGVGDSAARKLCPDVGNGFAFLHHVADDRGHSSDNHGSGLQHDGGNLTDDLGHDVEEAFLKALGVAELDHRAEGGLADVGALRVALDNWNGSDSLRVFRPTQEESEAFLDHRGFSRLPGYPTMPKVYHPFSGVV